MNKIDNSLYNFLFRRTDGMISLKKGLDAFSLRHKVISANIANSETPGYRAKRVSFEKELRKALDYPGDGVSRTNPNHIPLDHGLERVENVTPEVINDDTEENFNGVNNVDIEREMAEMATNQIHYSAVTKALNIRYKMLKKAMGGSGM